VFVLMSPSDRVSQLYPQAQGSLFVASYDSQGHAGGILSRLHFVETCTAGFRYIRICITSAGRAAECCSAFSINIFP
jgi:hypothetical protein